MTRKSRKGRPKGELEAREEAGKAVSPRAGAGQRKIGRDMWVIPGLELELRGASRTKPVMGIKLGFSGPGLGL